jgi:pSer/pThr/pTyr-binding forkhead associated (FHA) protein
MSMEANGELVPQGGGDTIPLVRDRMTVGRRESCDICLRFPNVSQLHCEFTFNSGYWYIQDLNSTNGIKVNGFRVQKKLLHPGDEVAIAKRKFNIQYSLAAGKSALAEIEEDMEDIRGQSLLERAGLEKSPRDPRRSGGLRGRLDEDED